jgi:hypothetical protein
VPAPRLAPPSVAGVPAPRLAPPSVAGVPAPRLAPPSVAGVPAPRLAPPSVAGVPAPRLDPPDLAPSAEVRARTAAAAVGRATRTGRKHLSALPGITVIADVIAARHCVDLLAASAREHPTDAQRQLWLAEALLRMDRDMVAWTRVRSIADPSSILVRAAVRQMALLGEPGGAPDPSTRLLKRAFALAAARVRRAPRDTVALHVLARVYLARRMPAETLRLLKAARPGASATERADLLVTAARAFRALRRPDGALRAAEAAVAAGSTLGYEIQASLRLADRAELAREPSARVAEWRELRGRVLLEHRARYLGGARAPADVARAVRSAQWGKVSGTLASAVDLTGRLRAVTFKKESQP